MNCSTLSVIRRRKTSEFFAFGSIQSGFWIDSIHFGSILSGFGSILSVLDWFYVFGSILSGFGTFIGVHIDSIVLDWFYWVLDRLYPVSVQFYRFRIDSIQFWFDSINFGSILSGFGLILSVSGRLSNLSVTPSIVSWMNLLSKTLNSKFWIWNWPRQQNEQPRHIVPTILNASESFLVLVSLGSVTFMLDTTRFWPLFLKNR